MENSIEFANSRSAWLHNSRAIRRRCLAVVFGHGGGGDAQSAAARAHFNHETAAPPPALHEQKPPRQRHSPAPPPPPPPRNSLGHGPPPSARCLAVLRRIMRKQPLHSKRIRAHQRALTASSPRSAQIQLYALIPPPPTHSQARSQTDDHLYSLSLSSYLPNSSAKRKFILYYQSIPLATFLSLYI